MSALTRNILVVLLTAVTAGCATMRIEVDVYKGPLANSEAVQLSKLANIALAAKPLLVSLRDELEWAEKGSDEKDVQDKVLSGRRKNTWWKPDYVPPSKECAADAKGSREMPCFGSERASRINDALCMLTENWATTCGASNPDGAKAGEKCEGVAAEALKVADVRASRTSTQDPARCLSSGLIRFSEQLVTFSNSESLRGRASLGTRILEVLPFTANARVRTDRYTALLQSLGNAIQVQADDIEQRRAYRARSEERGAIERIAVVGASRASAIDFLVGMDATLKAVQERTEHESKEFDPALAALTAELKLPEAQARKGEVEEKRKRLESDKSALDKEADTVKVAREMLPPLRTELLQQLTARGETVDATAGYALLLAALDKKISDASNDKVQLGKWESVKKTVRQHVPVPRVSTATEGDVSRARDQVAVMDALIAQLRQELIAAKRAGPGRSVDGNAGDEGATVRAIESALKEAYEQRASMLYIRPATAYLRTTSAATKAQEDSSLMQRNMLWAGFLDGITPKVFETDQHLQAIREDIDKQFWSNVNKVTVSGGGDTNYVIAKDDIGNWYVKNYSADPSQIIKSAQGLGLYALGGKLNTNLLGRFNKQMEVKKELEKAATPGERARLQEKLQKLEEQPAGTARSGTKVVFSEALADFDKTVGETEARASAFVDKAAPTSFAKGLDKVWGGRPDLLKTLELQSPERRRTLIDNARKAIDGDVEIFLSNRQSRAVDASDKTSREAVMRRARELTGFTETLATLGPAVASTIDQDESLLAKRKDLVETRDLVVDREIPDQRERIGRASNAQQLLKGQRDAYRSTGAGKSCAELGDVDPTCKSLREGIETAKSDEDKARDGLAELDRKRDATAASLASFDSAVRELKSGADAYLARVLGRFLQEQVDATNRLEASIRVLQASAKAMAP